MEGDTLDTIATNPGFWRATVVTTRFLQCPGGAQACMGGNQSNLTFHADSQCTRHGIGALCWGCERRFYRLKPADFCRRCPDRDHLELPTETWVLLGLIGLAGLMFLAYKRWRGTDPTTALKDYGAYRNFQTRFRTKFKILCEMPSSAVPFLSVVTGCGLLYLEDPEPATKINECVSALR